MSGFKTMAIEPGLRALYDQPDVPVVFFADGGSKAADAHVFAWPPSDAYGKLTRNHYRIVTLDRAKPEAGISLRAQVLKYDKQTAVVAIDARIDAAHSSLISSMDAAGEKVQLAMELADVFLYLVRLSDRLGVDLLHSAERKMAINAKNYPADFTKGAIRKRT